LNGATFGAYYGGQRFPVINFGVDVRGTVMPVKDTMGVTLVTASPRAVFHLPLIPFALTAKPWLAVARFSMVREESARITAGALLLVRPSELTSTYCLLIDWRVIDYSFIRLAGPRANQNSITTGIVRIPSVDGCFGPEPCGWTVGSGELLLSWWRLFLRSISANIDYVPNLVLYT
jgi:hypothetical protein